jgi:hypothetical protein
MHFICHCWFLNCSVQRPIWMGREGLSTRVRESKFGKDWSLIWFVKTGFFLEAIPRYHKQLLNELLQIAEITAEFVKCGCINALRHGSATHFYWFRREADSFSSLLELHLPPLRFHCVVGCSVLNPGLLRLWHWQPDTLTTRLGSHPQMRDIYWWLSKALRISRLRVAPFLPVLFLQCKLVSNTARRTSWHCLVEE